MGLQYVYSAISSLRTKQGMERRQWNAITWQFTNRSSTLAIFATWNLHVVLLWGFTWQESMALWWKISTALNVTIKRIWSGFWKGTLNPSMKVADTNVRIVITKAMTKGTQRITSRCTTNLRTQRKLLLQNNWLHLHLQTLSWIKNLKHNKKSLSRLLCRWLVRVTDCFYKNQILGIHIARFDSLSWGQ